MQSLLSGLVVLMLLFSGGLGSFIDTMSELVNIAEVHPGEQTAEILPPDTDGYLTINLRPGLEQLEKMGDVLSNWLDNPAISSQVDEVMSQLESETGINIEGDILPWLGPEVALGVCHDPEFMLANPSPIPIHVVIVGTFNRAKSDAFLFNKLFPLMFGDGEPPTEPNGSYRDIIDTLYYPDDDFFMAFTDDYIIWSHVQARLEAVLDLYLYGGDSLYTTPNFQTAQASLPPERMIMGYANIDHMITGFSAIMGEDELAILEAIELEPYLPSFAAGSIYFVDDGIRTDYYMPTPEGMADYPFPGENPLNLAKLVPGNALGFFSDQDLNSGWLWMKPIIAEHWLDIKAAIGDETLPDSLDDMLAELETMLGFSIEQDVLAWMNGEISFAMMPFTGEIPEMLLMFEVDDPVTVQQKLDNIVAGFNEVLAEQGEDPPIIVPITISGRDVISVQHPDFPADGLSPCYAFLDVDSSHYLVFTLTESAMGAAIDALNHAEHSLAENGDYQWMLTSLPETKMSLGYIDIQQVIGLILSLAAPAPAPPPQPTPKALAQSVIPMLDDGGDEADIIQELLPMILAPLHSLGMSEATVNPEGMSGTMVLRVGGEADILAYYRAYSGDLEVVDTTDLLKAANDWANEVVPPGFTEPISTTQLLTLANEWAATG